MTSKRCDEYQLALEMGRHSALDVREVEEARQHVAACPECRRAESLAAELNLVPGAVPSLAPRFAEVSKSLARDRFWRKYMPLLVIASFSGQGVFLAPLFAPDAPLRLWALVTAVGVLVAVGLALTLRHHHRRALDAASQGVEAWIGHRRAHIDTELKDLRAQLWLFPALAVGMAGTAFLLRYKGTAGFVVLLGAAAVNIGVTVYLARTRRPQLLRERAELEVSP